MEWMDKEWEMMKDHGTDTVHGHRGTVIPQSQDPQSPGKAQIFNHCLREDDNASTTCSARFAQGFMKRQAWMSRLV